MEQDDFRAYFETLELDPTLDAQTSLRTSTLAAGRTIAYGGLPSVDLSKQTNPEFELGDTIGEGGMGVVRAARQLALHREVAVKTLRPERSSSAAREGLLHEALVTGGLEHPNVVPIYTLGQTADGAPVIVMKRIEGTPWGACIADAARAPDFTPDDPLGWHLEIFGQLCQAVHFAHSRGILHRDIKPDNVMIGEYGEVYLVDWGVAVTTDEAKAAFLVHARDVSGVSGTPAYMAPELTTGDGALLGVHTDVYLLGATLYHALTGQAPHQGKSLFEIMFVAYRSAPVPDAPGVPTELLDIVRRAMAKEPTDRYESAEAMRRAVVEFSSRRASIAVADEARARLQEVTGRVAQATLDEDATLRGLFGECRFGFEQALKVWPGNTAALRGRDETLRQVARWELRNEHVRAAEAALAQLSEPDEELAREIEEVRARLAEQDADLVALRRLRDDVDLSVGAGVRAVAAGVAVIVWTLVPLVSGMVVRSGEEISEASFVAHGFSFVLFFLVLVWVMQRRLLQNEANRRVVRVLLTFGVLLPAYRVGAMQIGLGLQQALALEMFMYALGVGAVGILSNRSAAFGVVVYLVAGTLAARSPERVFEILAPANFLALGWLAAMWARQRN